MRTDNKRSFKAIFGKAAALILAIAVFAVWHTEAAEGIRNSPESFFASSREELSVSAYAFPNGVLVEASGSRDERLGEYYSHLKLFGLIPVKRVPTFIGERAELIPGGEAVGVGIYTRGVLVVGLGDIADASVSPAARAGLKAGDVILRVNGVCVDTADELTNAVASSDGALEVIIERSGKQKSIRIDLPADGSKKLGAWVRDSTVGVGTLSFIDPNEMICAALGHSVSDRDTGLNIRVKEGSLRLAKVLGVIKGEEGSPGELQGTFDRTSPVLSTIELNSELGIFGSFKKDSLPLIKRNALPVVFPDEVILGDAVIICSAEGEPKPYSCRIIKAGRQSKPAQKGLIIEITDERLLSLTGGIVQGMSGSPIIQNGRLVGAVTHVFVNDPTRGYGAYAYWMYLISGGGK